MHEHDITARLKKIKASIIDVVNLRKEADQRREHLFAEVLSELDQEYDRLVALVRTAKYELIFKEVLSDNKNNSGESYGTQ